MHTICVVVLVVTSPIWFMPMCELAAVVVVGSVGIFLLLVDKLLQLTEFVGDIFSTPLQSMKTIWGQLVS